MAETRLKKESDGLYRKLAKIAIPISIQGVVSATLSLVDNLMVGVLGETELAAVGIGSQIFMIFYMFVYGFSSGAATFMAQFYGAKDYKNIRKVAGYAASVCFGVGILFFIVGAFFTEPFLKIYTDEASVAELAASYIRIDSPVFLLLAISVPLEMAFKSTQQTRVPMIVSAVVFTTNMTLNYIFIFGKLGFPAFGVAGAAMGTLVARIFETSINILFMARKNNVLCGRFRDFFGWKKEMAKRVTLNSIPTTANELLWCLGQSMFVAAFSRMGITAYAAFQAAFTISNLFSYAGFSIGDAALILIGQKLGEGDSESTYELGRRLLRIGLVFGTCLGLALILAAKPLVGLFALTDLGMTYAFRILVVLGIFMNLNLYNGIQVTGTLRAGGDTKYAMIAESLSVWLIAVPMAFIAALVLHVPVYTGVLMLKTEEIVKALVLRHRFRSKKWTNTVIHGL